MKTYVLLASLTLALFARAADTNALCATAETAIERGMMRPSATDIEAAVKPIDAALASDPKNPALMYTRAFAHFAMSAARRAEKDNEAVDRELSKAISILEHVKGQPWEAEAIGLGSHALSQLIGVRGGMSGMTLGPKASSLLGRAVKAQPKNPRVLFYQGTSLYNMPAAFGGDPVAGTALLQQAVDAFAKADSSAPGPHWGYASALTWLGMGKQKAGDLAAARAAWETALKLEPDYGWVKFALLPSLAQNGKK